ncbi:MAG: hypothetical protein ACK4SZ_10110 [Allosphingosinicella sp.]|uniref:hypothetical protein n=1 Tax=Allosphingosinicella sp. TaxID=2823234 RepID=UPI003949A45C
MHFISTAHYTAFGQIVHFYASVEFGIKACLAGILEVPLIESLIMCEPYSAAQLKNVAKSITKESRLSDKDKETFCHIVGEWSGFSSLRNQIAHNRWSRGSRPGSIIPVGIDIRSGRAIWIVKEDSRDWLAPELSEEADKIGKVNARLQRFHNETGIAEIIDRKDAERNSATDSSEGSDTKS